MATNVIPSVRTEPKIVNRWVQMCAGIVAMMAIANLQYAWTLFTKPLTSSLHTTLAAVHGRPMREERDGCTRATI